MIKRPWSVSIAAWFLIATGLITAVWLIWLAADGRPMLGPEGVDATTYLALMLVSAAVTVVIGFGLLRGGNWARWLFVLWALVSIAADFLTFTTLWASIANLVLLAVIAAAIFHPGANAWFRAPRA